MPLINHFNNLIQAFRDEWTTRPEVLRPYTLQNDQKRFWWIEVNWNRVASWECRPFHGCSALITTTQFQVMDGYREQGIGRALRELMHKAYKRAGFSGEIATVRGDNAVMQAFMSGRVIEEFPSDFGGTFKMWLTKFPAQIPVAPRVPFTYAAPPCGYRTPYTNTTCQNPRTAGSDHCVQHATPNVTRQPYTTEPTRVPLTPEPQRVTVTFAGVPCVPAPADTVTVERKKLYDHW